MKNNIKLHLQKYLILILCVVISRSMYGQISPLDESKNFHGYFYKTVIVTDDDDCYGAAAEGLDAPFVPLGCSGGVDEQVIQFFRGGTNIGQGTVYGNPAGTNFHGFEVYDANAFSATTFDVQFDSWEHDVDPYYEFNSVIAEDDNPCGGGATQTISSYAGNPGITREYDVTCGIGNMAVYRDMWRYHKGNTLADALDFGTLQNGNVANHTNRLVSSADYATNTNAPDITADLWYTDEVNTNGVNNKVDIIYKFHIDVCQKVTVANMANLSNIDFFLFKAGSGNTISGTIGSFINQGSMQHILQGGTGVAGDYFVVVNGGSQGLFDLSITVDNPVALSPGTISYSGYAETYDGYDPPEFLNTTSPLGDRTELIWETKVGPGVWNTIANSSEALNYNNGPIQTIGVNQFRRKISNDICGTEAFSNTVSIETFSKNGSITGTVVTPNGGTVSGVTITLTNETPITGSPDVTYTNVTNNNGQYSFSGFYLGPDAVTWRVSPSFTDHVFSDTLETTMSHGLPNPNPAIIDIIDESSFNFTGEVYHNYNGKKPMPGVIMTLDGIPQDTTDINGQYSISISSIDNYEIKANYEDHQFDRVFNGLIDDDASNEDFVDLTTRDLTISLSGGCNANIGDLEYSIVDTSASISISEFSSMGIYQKNNLPARKYFIQANAFTPLAGTSNEFQDYFNQADIVSYVNSLGLEVDLSLADTTINIVYHPDPSIEINNWPEPPCPDIDYGVIEIFTQEQIEIKTYDFPPNIHPLYLLGCPLDTGSMILFNDVGSFQNQPIQDSFPISNGVSYINLSAGAPNLVAPHNKNVVFNVFDTLGNTNSTTLSLIVEGNRPRESTFATVSPQIPQFILRDPPGDVSYSTIEVGEAFSSSVTIGTGRSKSVGGFLKGLVDYENNESGTKIMGEVGGSFLYNGETANSTTTTIGTTTTSSYSTGATPANPFIGDNADVYVAAAYNIKYAISDLIRVDQQRCEVKRTQELTVNPDSFATTIITTQFDIENTLIPNLRDDLLANSSNPDSVAYFKSQIKIWENTIRRNQELKANAELIKNITFTGGAGEVTETITSDEETSVTSEFNTQLDGSIIASFGAVFGGIGGQAGYEMNTQVTTTRDSTNVTTNSSTVTYTLDDDDAGDIFTVDILKDNAYPNQVFRSVAAETSCPYEPGSLPKHDSGLTANVTSIYGIDPDDPAVFQVSFSNLSPAGETLSYVLDFNSNSNVNNAVLDFDENIEDAQELDTFQVYTRTFSFRRNPNNGVYAYEGLEFRVFAGCTQDDNSIVADRSRVLSNIKLNFYFDSSCSNITISDPDDGWVSSQSTNSELDITLTDYTINDIGSLFLQYRPQNGGGWQSAALGDIKNQLNPNAQVGTVITWPTNNIPDGNYLIRANINCPGVINYSDKVEGTIDNTSPLDFGSPFPIDRVLTSSNFIGLDINEPFDPNTNSDNIVLTNSLTGIEYDVEVVITGNRIVVVPEVDLVALPTASYNITFQNIKDQYLNPLQEDVDWWFSTGAFELDLCDENTVLYVDNSLNRSDTWQNGSSWDDAFVTLNDALDEACPGSTIHVAQGTYYPTDGSYAWNSDVQDTVPGDDIYFEWTHSYNIIGGFPSGGGTTTDRDVALYPTIISGDANKDGIQNTNDCRTLMKIRSGVDATLDGFIFEDNYAAGSPDLVNRTGAIFNEGDVKILNCIFRNNITVGPVVSSGPEIGVGGAFYHFDGKAVIANSLFHDNFANSTGGAIAGEFGELDVINCTFASNTCAPRGDAIGVNETVVDVYNSIFFDNGDDALNVANTAVGVINVYHSSFDFAALPVGKAVDQGGNMFSNDPSFEDASAYNYKLQAVSNVVEQGNKTTIETLTTIDLANNQRVMNASISSVPQVDMGAYELTPCADVSAQTVLYVDGSVASSMSGFSWASPFKELSTALIKASNCGIDTIYVAEGYYTPTTSEADPRMSTFSVPNGAVILGGYPTGGGIRDAKQHLTILSGNLGDTDMTSDNAYHVVSIINATLPTVLDGFTIIDGNADGTGDNILGGGLYHKAAGYGVSSAPIINGCTFKYNAALGGGAVANVSTDNAEARMSISNSIMKNNHVQFDGGAIYDYAEDGTNILKLENSIVANNIANATAGGVYIVSGPNSQSRPVMNNNTIYGNESASSAGGIRGNTLGSGIVEIAVYNSIIYGNMMGSSPSQLEQSTANTSFVLSHNNIEGGYGDMTTDIDTLPYFVGAHVGNFQLDACSPLIDKGLDTRSNTTEDLLGNDRKVGTIDIGAVEYDGTSRRDHLPETLDDIVLNCLKPLHFPVPSDGITYALYDAELTVLIGGPEAGDVEGKYFATNDPMLGDTSFQVIVGRDQSMGIDLTATTGVIEIPHSDDLLFEQSETMTFYARVKPTTVSGRQRFIVKNGNYGVGLEHDGLIFSTYGNQDNIFSGLGILPNVWSDIEVHYLPLTDNTGQFDIFINKAHVASEVRTVTSSSAASPVTIGGVPQSNTESYDGEIDYLSVSKGGESVMQYDFISAQGSDQAIDLRLLEAGGSIQHGTLNGLDRYEVWIAGEDMFVKLCPDTLTFNVLIQPETKTQFVMNNLDEGYKSLRERIEYACPNDTIRFANVLMGDTIKFESEIFLNKDLFIEGLGMNNGITLDGQDFSRLFDSPTARSISYKDMQMINGSHPLSGGAFPVPNDCTLWNVRFSGHNKSGNKLPMSTGTASTLKVKGSVEIYD